MPKEALSPTTKGTAEGNNRRSLLVYTNINVFIIQGGEKRHIFSFIKNNILEKQK